MAVRILSLCLVLCGLWCVPVTMGTDTVINVHQVEGVINPVVVEYMTDSIRRAEETKAVAGIFQLDTPGGLVDSPRENVKAPLNANVPTGLYFPPRRAPAAPPRTFITMAAHIAAMAPGTNIGAAHPVSGEGKDIEGDMRQKAENDLAAFARSIAEKRRRNAEWAEKAVRESVAVTEVEAREQRVIDVIAEDIPGLVKQLDGRQVILAQGAVTLHTAGATVRVQQMTWRQRLLAALSHPQIALMLLSLGSIGLLVELYNPGLIFPGVVGALALLLAFYSLQTLPINYTGLLLIGLGMVMFILEIKVTSFGMLFLGGVVAMSLGALMLIDSPEEYLHIPLSTIVLVVGTTAGLFLFVVGAAVRSVGRKPVSGQEGMLGAIGTAKEPLYPTPPLFFPRTPLTAPTPLPIYASS